MNNQLSIKLLSQPTVTCECGSVFYSQKYVLKKIPALLIGAPEDQIVNIPVFVCDKCGKILPDDEKAITPPTETEKADIKPKSNIIIP